MKNPPINLTPRSNQFTNRLDELRRTYQAKPPNQLAACTGTEWVPTEGEGGAFRMMFWGREVRLSYPGGEAFGTLENERLLGVDQTLLLYYYCTADLSPLSRTWISFSELQDGRFYNQAFQSYTGKELARAYQDDLVHFQDAAARLGGTPETLGDASYQFTVLPKVPLLVVYWLGDEDFPPSSQILFDANASFFLPTDAYAILGSKITRKLVAAKRTS